MKDSSILFSNKKYNEENQNLAKEKTKDVLERFNKWTVSFKYLLDQDEVDDLFSDQAAVADSVIMHEEERVSKYQRLLLEVEKKSVLRKQSLLAQKQKTNNKIVIDLINKHEENFRAFLEKKEVEELIKFPSSYAEFLAFAYTDGITINKIHDVVIKNTALADSIIALVNNPTFCHSINKTAKNIRDLKTAIGFIGIERCKMLLPVLMLKPLLKWNDSNTKLITPKIWQHAILTANATKKRLEDAGFKYPEEGFAIGLIRNIGHFIIMNYFTMTFEKTMEEIITYYRDNGMREEFYACADITPKLRFLPSLLSDVSEDLTRKIVNNIDWGHRPYLREAIIQDIDDTPVRERSLHSVALMQGRSFSIHHLMTKSNAFLKPYANVFFAHCLLSKDAQKGIASSNPGLLNK